MKPADSIRSSRFAHTESLTTRFLSVNLPCSGRFYLLQTNADPAVSPCVPYWGASYASPNMFPLRSDADIRVFSHGSPFYQPFSQVIIPLHSKHDDKPTQSYIGLIGKAILSSPQQKLVLSDIYDYIQTNYPYFRNRGPGWRNSIRHNLSLNDCFVKVGRSPNGKGHFWAINTINYDDFSRGEYKRKRRVSRRNHGFVAAGILIEGGSGQVDEMKRQIYDGKLSLHVSTSTTVCSSS